MPAMLASLALSRRLRIASCNEASQLCQILRGRSFSASSPDRKPTSLSDRMNFLFDQIDALERERADKDQTLKRIRAWRQSKDNPQPYQENSVPQSDNNSAESRYDASSISISHNHHQEHNKDAEQTSTPPTKRIMVEMAHPWPEWIELIEKLAQQNYFAQQRRHQNEPEDPELGLNLYQDENENEDRTEDIVGVESDSTPEADIILDFNDARAVQKACLNFGKDRFDILKSLSRRDIQILVGYGCPNADRRTLFSAKLLRKYTHLDEGDVCSNCTMRSTCEKAYLLTDKYDEARFVDLMRVLLGYGLDSTHGTVTNKPILKQKAVRTVVRKLLHEIVKLCSVPIDPNLPRPVVRMAPPKVKQPPPAPKKRVGRMDAELKKGDWICTKCQFLNFAKNTICLQCDAKRPKRQLQPGEWECPQCNFLNYRKNMACFHCECKRPVGDIFDDRTEDKRKAKPDSEKIVKRADVSGPWNFNFDDDESDGADVAAFEYADSAAKPAGKVEWDDNKTDENPSIRSGIGFDDFDDYSIDDLEVDTQDSDRRPFSDIRKRRLGNNSDNESGSGKTGPRTNRLRNSFPEMDDRRTGKFERRNRYVDDEETDLSDDQFGTKKSTRTDDRRTRSFNIDKSMRGSGYGHDEGTDCSGDEYEPSVGYAYTDKPKSKSSRKFRMDEESDDYDDGLGTPKMGTRSNVRRNAVPGDSFKDFRSRKDDRDDRRARRNGYGRTDFNERYGGKQREGERDFGEFRNSRRVIER